MILPQNNTITIGEAGNWKFGKRKLFSSSIRFKMVNVCCVVDCENRKPTKGKKYSLFKFPKCFELRNEWIKIVSQYNGKITRPTFVCEQHFDPKYINQSYSWWDGLNEDKVIMLF